MDQLNMTEKRNKEQVPFADFGRDGNTCGTQIRSDPTGIASGQISREDMVLTACLSESLNVD